VACRIKHKHAALNMRRDFGLIKNLVKKAKKKWSELESTGDSACSAHFGQALGEIHNSLGAWRAVSG
jgi:hypothetical protein